MKGWPSVAALVSLIATSGLVFAAGPEFRPDGVVIAFHKSDRALNIEEARSGDLIERWIVRLASPGTRGAPQLAAVRYMRRLGRITDTQLSTTRWRFSLRAVTGWEKENCVGPTIAEGSPMKLRPSAADDFERTAFGKGIPLPEFANLPCYVAEKAPRAISRGTPAR